MRIGELKENKFLNIKLLYIVSVFIDLFIFLQYGKMIVCEIIFF